MVEIFNGNCIDEMHMWLPDNSVDSIVCDPPYELGFMGKGWDSTGIANSVAMWREALRVLKPGGHLLAFSGTRTYHRMVCAIEDAGFEIRDQIGWLYGSGFPKSRDVSKAIDAEAGAERELTREGTVKRDGYGEDWDTGSSGTRPRHDIPATDAARQWQGWGTALKPAWEPIVVARKPLAKGRTVAANVLAHGTGAINVDGCRVPADDNTPAPVGVFLGSEIGPTGLRGVRDGSADNLGRWPANVIHDGSDEVLAAFPQAPGQMAKASSDIARCKSQNVYGAMTNGSGGAEVRVEEDKSAARFFYCAKASKKDRGDGNTHPTVKPTDLMRYLCRLVTPPGGTVLDPFMGSGSTGRGALLEGFRFIGIDQSAEYVAIARARIEAVLA